MQQFRLSFLFLVTLMITACGSKGSAPSNTTPDSIQASSTPTTMDDRDAPRDIKTTATHGQHNYDIRITSAPDASQPKVKDSYGDDYLDNRFSIAIVRDGTTLCTHSFTKELFLHLLNHADAQRLILGGIAFKEVDSEGFSFGAQLNGPDDQEGGVVFEITIPLSGQGTPYIERDTTPDIESAQNDEPMD